MRFSKFTSVLTLLFMAALVYAGTPPAIYQPTDQVHKLSPQGSNPTDDYSVYLQDFESGLNGWTTNDVTAAGLQWHIDDFNAYAGDSWWCGDPLLGGYDNHWLQYLVTPPLEFSNVTSPVLTFKLFYAVEDPAGATAPYDGWDGCNVWITTDGGARWSVIQPVTPSYNCASLYSFGEEWGMGANIAGWGGTSGGWVDAQFDLSNYAGQAEVQFRFAFCSDPAYCTADDPALLCLFVDDVLIMDGAATLLSNNADDPPVPGEFTMTSGGASGDWWIIDDATYHSPSNCATCVIENHYNLSNALESDWITLPEAQNLYFTFWLWCDMLDFTGSGGTTLEDYYMVEVTQDGVVWEYATYGFYDYGDDARPGAASVGWEEYLPTMPFNGNIMMDLTPLAGQDIKIRWRVTTDGDDNGGIGTGLHIDDFNVWVSESYNNDVGVSAFQIPFPTSMSNGQIASTVTLSNFGNLDQGSVVAFARMDSLTPTPLIPWANIPSGESVDKTLNWTLTGEGDFYWDAYTQLMGDENLSNDTLSAGYVTVTPAGVFELGYDNRGYGIPNNGLYYWSYDPGNGAMVRFDLAEHEIPVNPVAVNSANMLFYSTGACVLHIFDAGTPTQPGAEIASINVNVQLNEIYPDWKNVSLTGVPGFTSRTDPFWFWVESLNADQAQIMGDDPWYGDGHFFTYDGQTATASTAYEYYIRCIAGEGEIPDVNVTLTPENPPIIIPANGGIINFNIGVSNNTASAQVVDIWTMITLPSGAEYGPLMNVPNINLTAGLSTDRDREQAIPAGAPAGDYTYDAYIGEYPDLHYAEAHFDFTKSAAADGGMTYGGWDCYGAGFPGEETAQASSTPSNFRMDTPCPNPFNPSTIISFDIPQNSLVSLRVYDINGREISVIQSGWMSAGNYQREFDGSRLASGIYFARLEAGGKVQTVKLVLVK